MNELKNKRILKAKEISLELINLKQQYQEKKKESLLKIIIKKEKKLKSLSNNLR